MKSVISLIVIFNSLFFSYAQACAPGSKDILDQLKCIQGLTVTEESKNTPPGTRIFDLLYQQPVDHSNPKSEYFNQRLVLIHRSENEPMVLQTSGYSIFGVRQTTVTRMFETNQLQVEHRFFSSSVPRDLDWSKLNIKQSADDFHRIVTAFKNIYTGRWLNTGASKGGMTSIYHRYFYPDDLNGTVADVAPLSFSRTDERYNDFINQVGGATYASCRENMRRLQIEVLKNRDQFLPFMQGDFSHLGSADTALEHAVIESVYYFWQYGNPKDPALGCSAMPVNGTVADMFRFLTSHAKIADYTNESLVQFFPYYYQAATELGAPDNYTAHLEPIRRYEFRVEQYTPKDTRLSYSNEAMRAVAEWVKNSADEILFVYGEFDPWSAGEFPISETGKNVKKFFVPGGNHGVKFIDLPAKERAFAVDMISKMLGKKPVTLRGDDILMSKPERESLEDFEFKVRRQSRL